MRKITGKSLVLVLFISFSFTVLNAQTDKRYAREIEEKILQVEQNLATWVEIENTPKWNLQERMSYYDVKGISIAVIKNYKVEWVRGYGWADSAEQRAVSTSTLFQAASMSKSLNGLGILKLVQHKKINLYRDINDYLTSYKFPYDSLSKGKKITTANLLSHTAGLNVSGFDGYLKSDVLPNITQILNGIKPANSNAVKSLFEPGLKHKYSGGGTTISQLIIEDVTGSTYAEYMEKEILVPLGMQTSFYTNTSSKDKMKLLATGYNANQEVALKYYIYPEQAAAGLWTNPTELAKYVIETQLSLSGKSNKILSKEMTQLMLTPYIDSSSALGVFIDNKQGTKYFRHGGVNEGFTSLYFGSVEGGNGAVVMCNSTDKTLLYEVVNSIATTYNWDNYYIPVLKKVLKVNSLQSARYVGKYTSADREYIISQDKDDLFLELAGQKWKIYFTSDVDFFMYQAPGIEHQFIISNGNVEAFQIKLSTGKNIIMKKTK